jgi:ATP-dependent protease ClpP protease subunit
MDVAPRSRGTIYLDSCGGSAYVGISLAGLIRLRGLEATAVVLGECSSAALLPFAACSRRFVTPHSSLYFHPVRWSSEEDVKLEEAAEWTRHFQVLEHEMDSLLSQLLGVPLKTLIAWTRPGRFFTGPEIVQAGLAQLVAKRDEAQRTKCSLPHVAREALDEPAVVVVDDDCSAVGLDRLHVDDLASRDVVNRDLPAGAGAADRDEFLFAAGVKLDQPVPLLGRAERHARELHPVAEVHHPVAVDGSGEFNGGGLVVDDFEAARPDQRMHAEVLERQPAR